MIDGTITLQDNDGFSATLEGSYKCTSAKTAETLS